MRNAGSTFATGSPRVRRLIRRSFVNREKGRNFSHRCSRLFFQGDRLSGKKMARSHNRCLRARLFPVSFTARDGRAPGSLVCSQNVLASRALTANYQLATRRRRPPPLLAPQHRRLHMLPSSVSSPQLHGREPHTATNASPIPHSLTRRQLSSPPPTHLPSVPSLALPRNPSSHSSDDPHRSLTPQRPSSSASTPLGSSPAPSSPLFLAVAIALSPPLSLSLSLYLYLRSPFVLSRFCFSCPGALVGSPSTLDPPHSVRWRRRW